MKAIELYPTPLDRSAFAPFGDVIETHAAHSFPINEGTTTRFNDLAAVDTGADGGRPLVNIFRARPRSLPITIRMLERHPLGSQAFYPLSGHPYLVVVAAAGTNPVPTTLHAFIASADQGVNYHRGVWHHPLLALVASSDFLIIDRGGPGDNLQEYWFEDTPNNAPVVIPESIFASPLNPEPNS